MIAPTMKDQAAYAKMGRELLLASEVKPGGEGTAPLRIVLCKVEGYDPYVVWWENMDDSARVGYPATFGGDYHRGSMTAVAAFRELADREGFQVDL